MDLVPKQQLFRMEATQKLLPWVKDSFHVIDSSGTNAMSSVTAGQGEIRIETVKVKEDGNVKCNNFDHNL